MTTGIKLTQEEIIKRIKDKYPNYDCSKVAYKKSTAPITLICPEHGSFEKRPTDGFECQVCSLERRTQLQTSSKEYFVSRSIAIHGDTKYNYDLVEYKTARIKVKIRCNVHDHIFEQSPYVHLTGKGCKLCANDLQASRRKADNTHFEKRSIDQWGDKFTYEKVDYKNAKTKVIVTCKDHGDFPTYPDNHWLGTAGCPDCSISGFSTNRSAILYVMRCGDITKVGIVNSNIERRRKAISKSFGYNFEVLHTFKHEDGLLISNTETEIITELRKSYKQPIGKFSGYSECFFNVCLDDLLDMIGQKLGYVND